ncbi:MAG TPA: glycosyltransferase family 87 protein [Chloroflexota bacterium]|nr:glycosyltransferase family 87 protein [Chloroflexota bacterium]
MTALCLAVLVAMVLSYASLVSSGDAGPRKSDFVPYYGAASLVFAGHGGQLYNFSVVGSAERAAVRPFHIPHGVMPYLYPPFFAVALAPLAGLPLPVAFLLWFVLNCAVLAGTLLALRRVIRIDRHSSALYWAAAISFFPVLLGLAQGQVSILLLGVITGTYRWLQQSRNGLAGALLSLLIIKPAYLVPILLVLVLHGRWRTIVGCAAGAAALMLSGVPFTGWSAIRGFAGTLRQAGSWTTQIGGFEPKWNDSMAGWAQLALPVGVSGAVTAAAVAGTLIALAVFTLRAHDWSLAYAAAVIAGLLISPHVLAHDLVLLLLPACLALRALPLEVRLVGALAFLYVSVPAGLVVVAFLPIQATVVAMIVFALYLARHPARRSTPPGTQPMSMTTPLEEIAC